MISISFAWNIDFNIAALAIFGIMLFLVLATQNVSSWQGRTFRRTLFVCILTTVGELFLSNACTGWGLTNMTGLTALAALCDLGITGISLLFCMNFITMTLTRNEFRKLWGWVLLTPFVLGILYTGVTCWSNYRLVITESGVFIHGGLVLGLILIRAYYVLVSVCCVVRYFRRQTFLQKVSMIFFIIAMMMSVIYAAVTDHRIYTLFEIAVSTVLMFVTLQNPMAYRDSFTDANNEKAFYDIVHTMVGDESPFTVVAIHPEGFTGISGAIGRTNGDKILKVLASFLMSLDKNAYVFHLAGTRFAILIKGSEDPVNTIEAIRSRFDYPFRIDRLEVPLSAVITCLHYPNDADSEDDLLQSLDYAQQVEVKSRNTQVYYGKEFAEKLAKRDQILQTMEKALDESGIEVFYQPIYSTVDRVYTAAEALARLPDGKGGFISPLEFIPVAEQKGDIIRLGEMVLEKVCSFISVERPQEFGIRTINVNLSAIQCMQERMAEKLISIIDAHQVPHSLITFEITESVAAVSSERIGEMFKALSLQGVRFALDDYGTGYSNVGNLISYDYSIVKIDKSIVWASQKDEKSMVALKYILALINDVHMIPLAEGIETQEQADSMESIGCHRFQGFLYSMPVPTERFMKIIGDKEKEKEKEVRFPKEEIFWKKGGEYERERTV